MYGVGRAIEYVVYKRKRTRLLVIEHYKSMFPDRVPQKGIVHFLEFKAVLILCQRFSFFIFRIQRLRPTLMS